MPGFIKIAPGGVDSNPFPQGLDFLSLDASAQRDYFRALLFPPPPESVIRSIVYASGWSARLGNETSLAAPRDIAAAVMQSVTSGQSIRDLARDLLPIVDGVRSTARRVARDESMRVSHAMQQAAWSQVDELIVGYQVNAVLDARTRPEHRARAGTIYYKNPQPGQKGMDECPHPPYEADGSWAYNCRCFISPVMVDPDTIAAEPVPAGTLDPELTAAWFDEAPERDRQTAVGAVRYREVKRALGRTPSWYDFIGTGGELLDTEDILART